MARSSIQVFQLVPAATLVSLRDELREAIFAKDILIDQKQRVFAVSASSGASSYVDHGALWKLDKAQHLPQSRQEALEAAERFLDAANARTARLNESASAPLRSVLPDRNQRRLESCTLAMRAGTSSFDHWLCRYTIELTAGVQKAERTPVLGMGLELRIGARGNLVAFSSQWRPVARTFYADMHGYDDFAFLLKHGGGSKQHDHDHDHSERHEQKLLYAYDGVGNQYYLAPYYYAFEEDHVLLSPASSHSLVVKIRAEDTRDGTRLTGTAYGGSGHYSFSWAYWNLGSAWQSGGLVALGPGDVSRRSEGSGGTAALQSVQTLPRSHYTVMLNVVDQRTGAYGHFQQTVYSTPKAAAYANV